MAGQSAHDAAGDGLLYLPLADGVVDGVVALNRRLDDARVLRVLVACVWCVSTCWCKRDA